MIRRAGEVSGRINIRPVRVGLALTPTLPNVLRAVEHACSSWGGMYFPIIPSADSEIAKDLARKFMIDVIAAVDNDPCSEALEELPGLTWRGRSPWGPLDPPRDRVTTRVLDARTLIRSARSSALGTVYRPRWHDDDPLAPLLALWFGKYDASEYGDSLTSALGEIAQDVLIEPANPIPRVEGYTPVSLTRLHIDPTLIDVDIGFVAIDVDDPRDLIDYWNLRALGAEVFPWPHGFEDRLRDAATMWLEAQLAGGNVSQLHAGDGTELPPHIAFFARQRDDIPSLVTTLVEERGARVWVREKTIDNVHWVGSAYPLSTEFDESFSSVLDDRLMFDVAIPPIDFLPRRREPFSTGVVAAQIEVWSERGLPPGYVVAVPSISRLASVLEDYGDVSQPFQRGSGDGRVLGVSADAQRVELRAVPSFSLIEKLFDGSEWRCEQTDDGRFTSRLIELLGGSASDVANQPSVRAVLSKAAAGHTGKPLPSLLEEAKRYQQVWPGLVHPSSVKRYPQNVVNYLLARRLLRPRLPLKCPECSAPSEWSPEDLGTLLTCPMCEESFPLGLALSVGNRREWLFRLAGNIPAPKLAETFPLMAAASVLTHYGRASAGSLPHALGMRVETSNGKREVDVIAIVDDRGLPVIVIGETKSYRDDIDERDLDTLLRVQRYFHSINLEAFILVATLREGFTGDALLALRDLCARAPRTLHYRSGERFALPIAMVARDLSVPYFHDDHPQRWGRGSNVLPDVAKESCRRNLGLDRIEYRRADDDSVVADFHWGVVP